MKKWFYVQERNYTAWSEVLNAETKADALTQALRNYNELVDYDKKHNAFYIAFAEPFEDDESYADLDTATEIININDDIATEI